MMSKLFRWAMPYKGPVSHLSLPEYALRVIVFFPLFAASFLPTIGLLLFLAFGGIWAVINLMAQMSQRNWLGFSVEDQVLFVAFASIWLVSLLVSNFIRRNFLTQR